MDIQASWMLYEPAKLLMINRSEVLRYLGYGTNQPDDTTSALLERCADELTAAVKPKCVYLSLPITVKEDGVILNGCNMRLTGLDIAAHLNGCQTAVLMAATLSEQADRLIRRAQASDMTAGLIMDTCATAAVEQLCDDVEAEIRKQYLNSTFRPRFSPGYGDLPIEIQKEFLDLLDAPRKIGLCATDSSILTPRKSVTAIIGVGEYAHPAQQVEQNRTGCAECLVKDNCAFRRRGEFCGLSKPAE